MFFVGGAAHGSSTLCAPTDLAVKLKTSLSIITLLCRNNGFCLGLVSLQKLYPVPVGVKGV